MHFKKKLVDGKILFRRLAQFFDSGKKNILVVSCTKLIDQITASFKLL